MDTLFDQENPESSEEQQKARRKDELSELRNLLLKPEQTQLEQLQDRLDDPKQQARDVSRVLPEAILLRSKEDQQITKTLTPILEEAVKTSVKKNPRILVNAIFPIIGPAIRKAIANTLRGMVQSFSQMLDQSFSLKALKWRLEAFRTGTPFAEVVLFHTLVYRVEEVFLIHRETGIPLHHVVADGVTALDPDLVSSMRTAIEDFSRDSLRAGKEETMDDLRFGELNVSVEAGPLAVLAIVFRGNAPLELRSIMQDVIETIHFEQGEELESFSGDTAPFELSRQHLQDCLQAQYVKKRKRTVWGFWGVAGIVSCILLFLLLTALQRRHHWIQYFEALRAEPGIVVTSIEKQSGTYHVIGLRDPLAADPASMLRRAELDTARLRTRWEAYHSFHPAIVGRRATEILHPPATVTLTYEDGILTASGSAPQEWLGEARQMARFVPGVVTFDDGDVVATEDETLLSLKERIEKQSIQFSRGSTQLVDAQGNAAGDLVSDIRELLRLGGDLNKGVHLVIVGHTDATGSEAMNMNLSQRRAEEMLSTLTSRELPVDVFSAIGVGSNEPISLGAAEADRERNRCVTFRVEIRDNDGHTQTGEFP